MVRTKLIGAGIVMALAMTVATPASAAVITFTPDFEFSGSGSDYTGVITYTLEDVAGGVQFSIDWTAPAIANDGEYLAAAYLNLDPALDAASAIGFPSGLGTCTGCVLSGVSQGTNAFKADGDGDYDLLFDFDNAPPANRLSQGDSYTVFMAGNITTSSFLFFDEGGAKGDYMVTARVRGLGADNAGSGWFGGDDPDEPDTIPEPASLTLMAVGLAFGAARLRRTSGR